MITEIIDRVELIKEFKSKYRINIEEACFSSGWIPPYIILDRTRNIHSYAVFINEDTIQYNQEFENELIEYAKIRYSSLDRPLFVFLVKTDRTLDFFEIEVFKEFLLSKDYSTDRLKGLWVDFELILNQIKSEL